MNKYFRSAVDRYNKMKDKDYLIHPISNEDSEIITELKVILDKVGLSDVKAILDDYKFKKDEEVRDDLLQWNIDHPKKPKGKEKGEEGGNEGLDFLKTLLGEEKKPPYLKIGDLMLRPFHIIATQKFEDYNEDTNEYYYGLILNPMPKGADLKNVPIFANEHLLFETEENRNNTLQRLEQFLGDNGIEVINLEDDDE